MRILVLRGCVGACKSAEVLRRNRGAEAISKEIIGIVHSAQNRVAEISQTKQSSKSDFFVKNRLTNPFSCAIICKLSTSGAWLSGYHEKVFKKTFAKPLDKSGRMWYNTEAVRESGSGSIIENWTTGDISTSKSECENLEIPRKWMFCFTTEHIL